MGTLRNGRWRLFLIAAAVAAPVIATAGGFGGFAADGRHYLNGTDRVCEVVQRGAPRCARRGPAEIAALRLDRGTVERGADARLAATARGAVIVVRDDADGELARWEADGAVTSIEAVHRSRDGRLVAIEYGIRRGGRGAIDAVVLAIARPRPAPIGPATTAPLRPSPSPPAPPAAPTVVAEPTLASADLAARDRAIAQARAALGTRRWAKAEAAARAALAIDGGAPRARLALAAALARQGRGADASAELAALARAARAGAPAALVDAREDDAFAALLADDAFRRAVGLDPDPARPPSAYERLLGSGGRWEQPGVACKAPEVGLRLDRKAARFVLAIHPRCQGRDDALELTGRFEIAEPATLSLVFANPGGADERLACPIAPCGDGSGEDCLRCQGDDLDFTLRVVRR